MAVVVHEVEQGSDAWHEIRAGKYTGSNAVKLLRYGAGGYSRTTGKSFTGNFFTKRGHILEDEAIELYEAITKRRVARPGFITNPDFPNCGYSPDGIDGRTLLEVKCFNRGRHMKIYKGELPLEILAQIHYGMMICELKQAKLLIYNPELEAAQAFSAIPIKYNRAIATNFKNILAGAKT